MNILFLDIDGVLNSSDWFRGRGHRLSLDPAPDYELHQLDPSALSLLESVMEKTDCRVVISSTWRKFSPLNELVNLFIRRGMDKKYADRFIGMTPIHRTERPMRGNEIQDWLDSNQLPNTKIVIVDDDSDMVHLRNRLVLTNGEHGLTNQDVDKIVELFS